MLFKIWRASTSWHCGCGPFVQWYLVHRTWQIMVRPVVFLTSMWRASPVGWFFFSVLKSCRSRSRCFMATFVPWVFAKTQESENCVAMACTPFLPWQLLEPGSLMVRLLVLATLAVAQAQTPKDPTWAEKGRFQVCSFLQSPVSGKCQGPGALLIFPPYECMLERTCLKPSRALVTSSKFCWFLQTW